VDAKQTIDTPGTMSVAEGSSSRRSRRPLLGRRIEPDRLTWFAFLLGWQALVNQGVFGVGHLVTNPVWWVTNICIVLLILRPSSLALLTAALTLNVVSSWIDLPYLANHILFEDVVNLTVLGAIAVVWVRHRRGQPGQQAFNSRDRRAEIFELFAPPVRISVILLYFFVTLAKLNDDFFDPDASCAAEMYRDIVPLDLTNPFLAWTPTAAIYGTLLAEGGIPILLLFNKTRTLGVVSGLCFHLLLAFHPYGGVEGFSSMMFALLVLFTGEGFTATVNSHLDRLREGRGGPHVRRRYVVWALGGGLLAVALAVALGQGRLVLTLWLLWALPLITCLLIVLSRASGDRRSFREQFFAKPTMLYVFPILVLVNGMAPYLGLKTETSFSMFSNLRTEDGVTNHLFIPTSWQLATYQQDLVKIIESDQPEFRELAEDGYLLTRFEFERMLRIDDNFSVSCKCYGTTLHITKEDGVISGFDQEESFSPWLGGVLNFREVSQSDTAPCTH
jgi:hypothetical protein